MQSGELHCNLFYYASEKIIIPLKDFYSAIYYNEAERGNYKNMKCTKIIDLYIDLVEDKKNYIYHF